MQQNIQNLRARHQYIPNKAELPPQIAQHPSKRRNKSSKKFVFKLFIHIIQVILKVLDPASLGFRAVPDPNRVNAGEIDSIPPAQPGTNRKR